MPLILSESQTENWLETGTLEAEELKLKKLLNATTSVKLKAHTVQKLRGKSYIGNQPEITDEFNYETLEF